MPGIVVVKPAEPAAHLAGLAVEPEGLYDLLVEVAVRNRRPAARST